MKLTIEIESTHPRFGAVVAALQGTPAAAAADVAKGEPAKPARASRAKDKPAAEPAPAEPAPTEPAPTEPAPAEPAAAEAKVETVKDEAPTAPAKTRDDVARLILATSKVLGRAAALEVLETMRPKVKPEHKAEPEIKLPMVPPAAYGELYAALVATVEKAGKKVKVEGDKVEIV